VVVSEDHTSAVVRRYDQTAAAYQRWWAPVLAIAAHRLLAELPLSEARRIVDIGAGVGSLLPVLRGASAGQVLGIDRSHFMLALAPRELQRAVADARQLPLASASVDAALMFFMLFHLERPLEALQEARRILRPGGLAATITWAGEMESDASRIWGTCLEEHGAGPPPAAANHDAVNTPGKVESLLKQASFRRVRAWEAELAMPFSVEQFVALKTEVGSDARRLETLAPFDRDACVREATRRVESLSPGAFFGTGRIINAIAL
jgi:ubiquinone/menaquinone biosynthesis C-methylase UbiE